MLHVPHIAKKLLCVSQFAQYNNVFFEFRLTYCCVKNQLKKVILLKGILTSGPYTFNLDLFKSPHTHVSSPMQHNSPQSYS